MGLSDWITVPFFMNMTSGVEKELNWSRSGIKYTGVKEVRKLLYQRDSSYSSA